MGNAETELTESVLQFVKNMRSDVLGSIGLAFLIYTVVSTIQKVEESFNIVWQVAHPRTFARRFTEYLSVMIVGPILLAVALGLLASAKESPAARWLDTIPHLAWILGALGQLVSYAIVTAVFTFMYPFVPNTRVKFQAALIGGVTAGIIWALVGKGFTAFIVYSSQMVAIYTGFAIVLTTLVWVYLSWLILLIGAQLAFYVQSPQYLRHGRAPVELAGDAREQISLSVMYLIGRDYRAGEHPWSADRLAAELDIPETALAPVLGSLEKAGLARRHRPGAVSARPRSGRHRARRDHRGGARPAKRPLDDGRPPRRSRRQGDGRGRRRHAPRARRSIAQGSDQRASRGRRLTRRRWSSPSAESNPFACRLAHPRRRRRR